MDEQQGTPEQKKIYHTYSFRIGAESLDWKLEQESFIQIVLQHLVGKKDFCQIEGLTQSQINRAVSNINTKLRTKLKIEQPILTLKGNNFSRKTSSYKIAPSISVYIKTPLATRKGESAAWLLKNLRDRYSPKL